jgi:hypothetical protein
LALNFTPGPLGQIFHEFQSAAGPFSQKNKNKNPDPSDFKEIKIFEAM